MDRNGKKEFERSTWTCGTILLKNSLISDNKKNQQGVCHVYNLYGYIRDLYIYIYPYFIPKIHMYQVFGPQAEEDPFLF